VGRRSALEIERHLARHLEQLDHKTAPAAVEVSGLEWPAKRHRLSAHAVLGQDAEDRVGLQHAEDPFAGVDGKRLALAQMQQARDRINVGTGENDTFNRRGAQAATWMEDGVGVNLLAKIG